MEGNSSFAYKMIIFSAVILFALPIMLNAFIPQYEIDRDDYDQIMEDYYSFTGTAKGKTSENVWALGGIYTPYGQDAQGNPNTGYGYTEDGWIYGSRVEYNRPTQYIDTAGDFDVKRDNSRELYVYASNSADYSEPKEQTTIKGETITISDGQGHKKDDIYTSVVFDREYKSDIFFSEAMKYTQDGSRYVSGSDAPFYYAYTGYRYAFVPISSSWTINGDGQEVEVTRSNSSCSLIWYTYYNSDGISGQLIISGNDEGVAYLTSDQIIRAFDSTTSVAKFPMTFNHGIQMNVYVKIDARELASGKTVEQCYNEGYWSVMLTSISVDSNTYTGTEFELNPMNILETIVKLMTFDYEDFDMSPMMGMICSFIIVIPLYAGLIALALNMAWPAMVGVGILGVLQTLVSIIPKLGWPF